MDTSARESYAESPSFDGFPSYALSLVFAGRLKGMEKNSAARANVRLGAARQMLKCSHAAAYAELVQPTQSFFADILVSEVPLQRRPMILAVEAEPADGAERVISLVRPRSLDYVAEGREVQVGTDSGEMAFEFRDVFALFESGHLFYVLSLIPRSTSATPINEYHVITLQKLVNPTEETEALRDAVRLRCADGQLRTVVDFIQWRLSRLSTSPGPTNAVRDILPSILLKNEGLPTFTWTDLKSLLIAIEDKELFELINGGVSEAPAPGMPARPHMPVGTDAGTRRRLALAGMVQGIADFPFQDSSELEDSLQPIVHQSDVVVFTHPKFLIEVGPVWRSLADMRRSIGTCPYVLLTQLVLAYNQHLLEEVEGEIERLLYGVEGEPVRASVLGPLTNLYENVDRGSFGIQAQLIKRNLARRLLIYRDLILSRLPNIFRYPRERKVFDEVSKAYALEERFDSALRLLTYYDELSDDIMGLGSLIADRRMNRLLLLISAISAFGLLSVTNDLITLEGATAQGWGAVMIAIWLLAAFGLVVFAALKFVLWLMR